MSCLAPAPLRHHAALLLAAASFAGSFAGGPAAAQATAGGGSRSGTAAIPGTTGPWPVRTAEHVDLWLHGLALVEDDTARVPIFQRGYAERMRALRARTNVFTQLDAERDRLRARLAANPRLGLAAQFVPLAFASWDEVRQAADALVQAGGDPRRVRDSQLAAAVAYLAQSFPAATDRDWLRIYVSALDDERARFYHRYWLDLQRDRAAPLAAADSVWHHALLPRIERFLRNAQQSDGTLLLSPVLGGEGRTQAGSNRENVVAVTFPARTADAPEASYVAAHELVGALVAQVVADNTSPADQRAGLADRYVSAGQVRAGLLLLRRFAPDLADGYARYYLREAGLPAGANAQAALEAAFPLPQPILGAIVRQLDVVQGGI